MAYVATMAGQQTIGELESLGEISSDQYLTLNVLREADESKGISLGQASRLWGKSGKSRLVVLEQRHLVTRYPTEHLTSEGYAILGDRSNRSDTEMHTMLGWRY